MKSLLFHSRVGSNKNHFEAVDWSRNSMNSNFSLSRKNKQLQIATDRSKDSKEITDSSPWNSPSSHLYMKTTRWAIRSMRRFTEDGKICRNEDCPSCDVLRSIARSLIDIPSNVLCSIRTIAKTNSKESDLCCWIDPLIFHVGNTHSGNDTSKQIEELWNLFVREFVLPDGDQLWRCFFDLNKKRIIALDELISFVVYRNHPLIRSIREKWTTDNQQRRSRWLGNTFVSPRRIHFKWRTSTTIEKISFLDSTWTVVETRRIPKIKMRILNRKKNTVKIRKTRHSVNPTEVLIVPIGGVELTFVKVERIKARIHLQILLGSSCDHRCSQWNEISRDTRWSDSHKGRFACSQIRRNIRRHVQFQFVDPKRQCSSWNE